MPANGRFLLDTNIVIAVLEGDDGVFAHLGRSSAGRAAENIARVERFAAGRRILPCDLNVARAYGAVRQRLREKGRPIPGNDIWIAATAACHDLVLITRDRHFSGVDGLAVETW